MPRRNLEDGGRVARILHLVQGPLAILVFAVGILPLPQLLEHLGLVPVEGPQPVCVRRQQCISKAAE